LTLTKLLGKRMWLLLSRTLLVAECLTSIKSVWPAKPVSRKLTLLVWTPPPVCIPLFFWRYRLYSFIWENGIRVLLNAIKIEPFFEKPPFCVSGPIWRAHVFQTGMFRYNGHRSWVNKLLDTEY
jgi:hypothetical protein